MLEHPFINGGVAFAEPFGRPEDAALNSYARLSLVMGLRIRERLPRPHQELREGMKLSMYALWLKCGVSRDKISRVDGGENRGEALSFTAAQNTHKK